MGFIPKVAAKNEASEKLVKIHLYVVVAVCAIFGLVNIASHSTSTGIIILVGAVAMVIVTKVVLKNKSNTAKGMFLSVMQTLLICGSAITNHQLDAMFGMMIASLTLAAVYYDIKIIFICAGIEEVLAIGGLFMKPVFYGNTETVTIIKGVVGMNIACFMILYLITWSLRFIQESQQATEESRELLVQVKDQMAVSEELQKQQTSVVNGIVDFSKKVGESSETMLGISEELSASATEQEASVHEVLGEINRIAGQTSECLEASQKTLASTNLTANKIDENNEAVQKLFETMKEMDESSRKIGGIIKTIEDIAFQTNILALNAAVEAARAGDAGKGFGVVADEVRNLANRCSGAASDTSDLIKNSIAVIDRGTRLAKVTADCLEEVVAAIRESEKEADRINSLTVEQAESIENVKVRMDEINRAVEQNTATAEHSASIAESLADDVSAMRKLVSTKRTKA